MRILSLDHSVLSYKSFWRIFSEEYSGESNDEAYEFTRSYCGLIQYYVELFKADAVIWLLDCDRPDVWRHKPIQEYYLPRTEVWATGEGTYMGQADGIYRKVWTGEDGELHGKQLHKKDYNALAEDMDMEAAKVTNPELFAQVAAKIIPQYKGNREGSHWPKAAVLDKRTFQKMSMKLAKDLAPHFNGKLAKGANLEADDLARALVTLYGDKHEIVHVTTDKDWTQLCIDRPNVTIFDPNEYEMMNTGTDYVLTEMWVKLMSGDKSDNIKSIRVNGKVSGIGEKKARDLVQATGLKDMGRWIRENCEPEGLAKNKTLVNLKQAPPEILDRALNAIRNAVKPEMDKPLSYFVSAPTLELAKADAQKKAAKWDLMKRSKK
jgi:hypothetical protein